MSCYVKSKTLFNTMGRPREHDREKIAQDLIEWAKLETSINLNKFCCTREPPLAPSKITEFARECDNFRLAYEEAKGFIGARREEMLTKGTLHVKAYDLNANTYDYFLKQERRDQAKFEADLNKESAKHISQEDMSRFEGFIQAFKSIQSSDLNTAKTNINAEAKSELDG